jgi:hypothetical protein
VGSLTPETLFPRRLAWRALSMVLGEYQLGAMTLKLNPDDPRQCLPGIAPGELWFYEDFAGVAATSSRSCCSPRGARGCWWIGSTGSSG